jgi:hypothetical protein
MTRVLFPIRPVGAFILVILAVGCAETVSSGPDEVRIDTGQIGQLAPGTRQWFSWLQANEHCAEFGREPKLIDLQGSLAIYRCVVEEKQATPAR